MAPELYNGVPEIRELYMGYEVEALKRATGINKKTLKNPIFHELLIRNYLLSKRFKSDLALKKRYERK